MLQKINQVRKNLFIRSLIFLAGFSIFFLNFVNYIQTSHTISAWNIIFVVDISNSMNVKDVFYGPVQTSRLDLVKHIIKDNVQQLNNKFWLVVFSDKMDYSIPPTFDKANYLTYLDTINTNLLNWGETNFKKSMEELKKVLNPMDIVVIFSDFDFDGNYDVKFNNLTYFVGVGSEQWGIVKNKEGKTIFKNWTPLYSKLNKKIVEDLSKHNPGGYLIVKNWSKNKILPFLKKIKPVDSAYNDKKVDVWLIIGFGLILLTL